MAVRFSLSCALLCLVLPTVAAAQAEKPDPKLAVTDSAEAMQDVDFRLQGEYFGRIRNGRGRWEHTGLQVVALGDGRFDAVHYVGGLPGGGWNRSEKTQLSGERDGETLELAGPNGDVFVGNGRAILRTPEGREVGTLEKIHRVSPTLGARPPANAVVLFDGSNTDYFVNGKMTDDGLLQMGSDFRDAYQDFTLHIEYRLPYMPYARGQGRSNSGVYLQSRYEVQILDSFGLEGVENEAGALYRQRRPDVNMALPPLRWQTYDITFTAPRFDADGNKVRNARITVLHNGVPVHDGVEVVSKTGAGKPEAREPLPTKLQNHGNPIVFRNIWLVDRTPRGYPCCCR